MIALVHDNILVFLNIKNKNKNPITNQFDLKYREKNSKPNNKSINLFTLNLNKKKIGRAHV